MIQGVQISMTATSEQIELMETQCEIMEGMVAHTLARRIEDKKPEEAIPFIRDWFKTVRQFAQGAFMASGIRSYCKPIPVPDEVSPPVADVLAEKSIVCKASTVARLQAELRSLLQRWNVPVSIHITNELKLILTRYPEDRPSTLPMGSPDLAWATDNYKDLVALLGRAGALCEAIEKLPASEHQTRLSTRANSLVRALQGYVYKAP